jgi:hypothetical protein
MPEQRSSKIRMKAIMEDDVTRERNERGRPPLARGEGTPDEDNLRDFDLLMRNLSDLHSGGPYERDTLNER